MEFLDVIKARHSTRSYTDEPVRQEDLDYIMAVGGNAPVSNHAYENLHFTLVTSPAKVTAVRERLTEGKNDPTYGATSYIFVSAKKFPEPVAYQDAACAIDHMGLAATEKGLGSVYIWGCIDRNTQADNNINALIEVPADFQVIAALAVGQAASTHPPKTDLVSNVKSNQI